MKKLVSLQNATRKRKEKMNPFIVYAMAAIIIACGFLFIKYIERKDKHVVSE